jgi:hypothetical protein
LFITPVHTAGIFNPSFIPVCYFWRTSSGHDIFYKLGMIPNQPMESHTIMTSTSYTLPLYHFTGMTSNVFTVSNQLLVGSHTILPLQLAKSTMVPHATPISTRTVVITQPPIGTPLPLRSNPSLPPGYNDLNTSITNPNQNPSSGSNIFVPPGYNAASSFISTPTQVLSGGPNVPPPPSPRGSNCPGPSRSNQVGGTSHFVTSSFQIPVGGQPQVGEHNPVYGKNIPGLQYQPWNFSFQGNQKPPGGKHPQFNYFLPPNLRKPYPGSINPTWGQNF